MNLNLNIQKTHRFDAIVVGSGMTGGMAAKELTEKGLQVLMIERGKELKHAEDYETAMKAPWEFQHRGQIPNISAEELWSNNRFGKLANEETGPYFTNDKKNPFIEKRPFDWIRAYHTGGKSMHWGRQSYRWNRQDFEANARDGIGVDWPIRYEDLEPWYDHVEKFVGISGQKEGLEVLPDGQFLPAMPMHAPEAHFTKAMKTKLGRPVTIGRVANLTKPQPIHTELGRASCQYRSKCSRGCPYGAYYSSLSGSIPAARKTDRLSVLHDSIVSEIIIDPKTSKASGVRVIHQHTLAVEEYYAKIIFLNAGSMNTAALLLNSKSDRFPNGLGNDSDQVGRNIMDHHLGVGASASVEGFKDNYFFGQRPNALYIPRFRNWGKDKQQFLRGYGYQGGAGRQDWKRGIGAQGFGASFKENLSYPGSWSIGFGGFGEVLPNPENRMYLDAYRKDAWGIPLIVFDAAFGENEIAMRKDMMNSAAEMLELAGFKNISTNNRQDTHLGLGIHDMGTARMGKDPKTSVLNKFNQVHDCKNVFVTDGAAMTSSSCVNPSITYMALTARAADYAVSELKKQNL
ncbi:choline dehydrogenase-like flavoprotein [Dyadobacter jejuensis]|uniref:Choline dehydrogenase-like flavoprotein n=1 Tax=Dyadobacter jejuensis TaxID=1082580 RepID=A0A316AKX4_9BACT|nr:GMC family oxidoreductase [Dyadobacter jejuensis]PWJ58423.1 choline dehydrogenase-like flavoprotein [Dyadobacter jejuensis]